MITKLYKKIRSILRPLRITFQSILRNAFYRIKRFFYPPKLPKNPDGKVLIHLGCGNQNDERYINVDGMPFPHVHYVSPVEKLPMFSKNYADLVYACHVLEHISHAELINVLKEWRRVLKDGGVLRLSVPDFNKLVDVYNQENKNAKIILPPLMGAQEGGKYDFHKTIFNKEFLSNLLKEAGFKEVREWDPENTEYYSFSDWAGSRKIYNKYQISPNLEGIK